MEETTAGEDWLFPGLKPYLDELSLRIEAVCGRDLVTVAAVGSVALGDYRHGRSDVDIMVVVGDETPALSLRKLAAVLRHPDLRCPAAGLELVVYPAEFVAIPSQDAGYLLDLNTGPLLPEKTSFDAADSPAFWYVIDRSIAHQSGRPLFGRHPRDVIAPGSRQDLLAAVRSSVRDHAAGIGHLPDNRVLNGCRSLVYARTGRWTSKRAAAEQVLSSADAFAGLLTAALHSFSLPRQSAVDLPAADVTAFMGWVLREVEATT
ncbi:aminoglycoside adenylyltransferase domain-containing protein [Streptomyces sp. NPDC049597]|uniref:nucleotidyltransferase domain-containing protein n=1 Tax=Streptomyces sp. NPDC049597 TaxID=3155276 RepID=UPI00341CEA39